MLPLPYVLGTSELRGRGNQHAVHVELTASGIFVSVPVRKLCRDGTTWWLGMCRLMVRPVLH